MCKGNKNKVQGSKKCFNETNNVPAMEQNMFLNKHEADKGPLDFLY